MTFEQLANEHKDAVYRQMIRVCRNREDAEDVLIEALMQAYRRLDQLQDQRAFQPWLRQIARRVCWNLRNRESLQPLMQLSLLSEDGFEPPSTAELPDEAASREELKSLLSGAIADLPREYQEVYQLRDVEDLSGEQVAARLGISLSAMKSRLHRARQLLRERLDAALQPS